MTLPMFPSLGRVCIPAALLLATPAPEAGATILTGVSASVADSSPGFNAAFQVTNTLDGTEAEYASATQGVNTFMGFNFGSPQTFDKIVVLNRNSTGQSDLIGDFTLTLDGGAATASVTRQPLRGSSGIHSLSGSFTATSLRLDVDTVGVGDAFNNTGAMEVFFVRTPAGHTPLTAAVFASAMQFRPDLNNNFSPDHAVDGVIGRNTGAGVQPEYASNGLGVDTFVDFDLGMSASLGAFDYFDRIADEDRITGFDLIFSQDATFGEADDIVRSYTKTGIGQSDEFAAISARYIRFDVTARTGVSANNGISEIVFYQAPEPSALAFCALGLAGLVARRRR